MKRVLVIAMMLLLPQLAVAGMYMCVDEATGVTTFTDKACPTSNAGEEIRVNSINYDESHKPRRARQKTWRSDAEDRKTGTQYNAQHRSMYDNKASASAN
jgi:hypothetical protein